MAIGLTRREIRTKTKYIKRPTPMMRRASGPSAGDAGYKTPSRKTTTKVTKKSTAAPHRGYYIKPTSKTSVGSSMSFVPGRSVRGSSPRGGFYIMRRGQADVEPPEIIDIPSIVPPSIPQGVGGRIPADPLEITLPYKGVTDVWGSGGGGGGGGGLLPYYEDPLPYEESPLPEGGTPFLGGVEGFMNDLNENTAGAGSLLLIAIIIAAGLAMSGEK